MAQHEHVERDYQSYVLTRRSILGFLVGLVVVASILSITIGPTAVPVGAVVGTILAGPDGGSVHSTIIWNIRLPRVIGAVVIGASLGLAGAVMQSVLNNPLGSPYTLGISQAAMFGAAAAIVLLGAGSITIGETLGITFVIPYLVTTVAFLTSLSSAGVILALAKYRGASPETMILTGIALGSLFTAGTTAIQYVASQSDLASIVFWSFGDVGRATWRDVALLGVILVPTGVYVLRHSWAYNALDAGEETARSVGIDVESVRNRGMLVASLITALAVAIVGIIGFVGLVVPHVVRKLIGNNKAFLLPASGLGGALLLLVSDTAARTVLSPSVLPVGIVTAFVGAPFFIYLVIRGKEYWKQ